MDKDKNITESEEKPILKTSISQEPRQEQDNRVDSGLGFLPPIK